ncbi:MAG: cation transporter [Firmicutes bacterium]|nr:cation transporter [Bacillota bacterium]
MDQRIKQIKTASAVGILGNTALALLKVILGFIAGSLAVVGDGVDSATDVLSFVIIFFALKIISKEPDEEHSYGHYRAEALATLIIAFLILFAGVQLLIFALTKIITAASSPVPSPLAVVVSFASVTGKLLLALYQFKIGRQTESAMLVANGRNMLADLFVSVGVLGGTFATITLRIPMIDQAVAIFIAAWIIWTAVRVFLEANTELMDGVKDTSIYQAVFDAVDQVEKVTNPHRTRIRKLANLYLIDLHIEVDGTLTVAEGHQLAMEVEHILRQKIENLYDVAVHVEPLGNMEKEKYGLSPEKLGD